MRGEATVSAFRCRVYGVQNWLVCLGYGVRSYGIRSYEIDSNLRPSEHGAEY